MNVVYSDDDDMCVCLLVLLTHCLGTQIQLLFFKYLSTICTCNYNELVITVITMNWFSLVIRKGQNSV